MRLSPILIVGVKVALSSHVVAAAVVGSDAVGARGLQSDYPSPSNRMLPNVQGPLILSAEATFVVLLILLGTGLAATPVLYMWSRRETQDLSSSKPSSATSRRHWHAVLSGKSKRSAVGLFSPRTQKTLLQSESLGPISEASTEDSPEFQIATPVDPEALASQIQSSLASLVVNVSTEDSRDEASSETKECDIGPTVEEGADSNRTDGGDKATAKLESCEEMSLVTDTGSTTSPEIAYKDTDAEPSSSQDISLPDSSASVTVKQQLIT
eukprot:CAMPEP_0198371566 /NCGR_PEP_ID=MMETSP1450-20131203/157293_1 /TAXON_ID=753684 ORGANISM="Madagascaria erythrocladiodes, Strain CCMP3234" /NCGR_SAMPLE_ID=MMETSP1450 /ASSEMBLY_ACC=CAM_ASM_001115 /LENGTH=267 /DNA_ID=CAMNT_0044079131 /DNA_START=157 /DNA_END=960 /DNA_ORIENTATION=+